MYSHLTHNDDSSVMTDQLGDDVSLRWNALALHLEYLSASDRKMVQVAFDRAQETHEDPPYRPHTFCHRVECATELAKMQADCDTLIAVLLLGSLQQQHVTHAEAQKMFRDGGATLATSLLALSATKAGLQESQKQSFESIRQIFLSMETDMRVPVISLVDRLQTMRTLRFLPAALQHDFSQQTLKMYVPIARQLGMRHLAHELEGLCLSFLEPEFCTHLSHLQSEQMKQISSEVLPAFQEMVESFPSSSTCTLVREESVWHESRRSSSAASELAIAFVCNETNDCYEILGHLHRHWQQKRGSFADYINTPAIDGSQELRTTVIMKDGLVVQCRIRTRAMQEYAHLGIASLCFQKGVLGLLEYFPWALQLRTILEDDALSAQECWHSIQTDILREQIMVHGLNGQEAMIPLGSTVLDAAFFCFQEQALWADAILVDGERVPLKSLITDGVVLTLHTSMKRKVHRVWLGSVQTHYAQSIIKTALGRSPTANKVKLGRTILQSVMRKKHRGFLDEFEESSFVAQLHAAGYDSLDNACIAVASGSLDADSLDRILFEEEKSDDAVTALRKRCVLRGEIDSQNPEAFQALEDIRQKYDDRVHQWKLQWHSGAHSLGHIVIRAKLSVDEERGLWKMLKAVGVKKIKKQSMHMQWDYRIATAAVVILWGMEPVLTKLLLNRFAVPVADITIIRFFAFFLLCAAHLAQEKKRSALRYHHLPWKDSLLWIGGISFALVGLTSYTLLTAVLPQDYVMMTYSSLILIPFLHPSIQLRLPRSLALLGFCSMVLTFPLLQLLRPELSWNIIGVGVFFLLSFVTFSVAADEFKRRNNVSARMPAFLFKISCIALACCAPLLFVSTRTVNMWTLFLFLYTTLTIAIPYVLYYTLMRTEAIQLFVRYFFVGMFLTLGLQVLLLDSLHSPSLLLLGVMLLTVYLFYGTKAVVLPGKEETMN